MPGGRYPSRSRSPPPAVGEGQGDALKFFRSSSLRAPPVAAPVGDTVGPTILPRLRTPYRNPLPMTPQQFLTGVNRQTALGEVSLVVERREAAAAGRGGVPVQREGTSGES